MRKKLNLLILIFLIMGCHDNSDFEFEIQPEPVTTVVREDSKAEEKIEREKTIQNLPKLALPFIPEQSEFLDSGEDFSGYFEFNQESNPFRDDITIEFESDSGFFSRNNNYVLVDSYLGDFDGILDNIKWNTPWKMISVNMDTFRVYGGDKAGKGAPIGYISWNGKSAKLVLQTEYEVDKKSRTIFVKRPKNVPYVTLESCPTMVENINGCLPYVNIYNAVSSIDFQMFGEISEDIARDILSLQTSIKLIKSFWNFDEGIDDIRTEYLVPLLKSISQMKKLKYLKNNSLASKEIYSEMIYTMIDTSIKTQTLMPEAMENMGMTSFGVLLAYVGAEDLGDSVIAYKQPEWFQEIVSPIIREVGILAIGLLDNPKELTLIDRVQRFLDLEQDIRNSIKKICHNSKNSNECLAAMESID